VTRKLTAPAMSDNHATCAGWPKNMTVDPQTYRVDCADECQTCVHAGGCAHSARIAIGYVDADPTWTLLGCV
jgi:hypothetical protein